MYSILFSTASGFVLMSTLTLLNAKLVESHFNSKIVLNRLSTDDNIQVATVLTSKQLE